MPKLVHSGIRTYAAGITAVVLAIALFAAAKMSVVSASPSQASQTAAAYKFKTMPIAMPPGYRPTQTVRQVNPAYAHLRSWISSVGAGIALTDLTGHGVADD